MAGPGLHIKLSKINDVPGSRRMLRRPYYFQNPPLEEFSHGHGHESTTYMTIGRGEFSQRLGRRLITVSFRTLIVEWSRFAIRQTWDVEALTDELIEISEKGYPFRLVATHSYSNRPELDIEAIMTDCTPSEVAGEIDTRYFDLSFREWRDPVVDRATKKKRSGGKHFPFTITLRKDGTYTVVGEKPGYFNTKDEELTFAVIAKYAYGAPSRASVVARANGMTQWGLHTPLTQSRKYKDGGKIVVPAPPVASINQPDD
jgi:hypothetical protein